MSKTEKVDIQNIVLCTLKSLAINFLPLYNENAESLPNKFKSVSFIEYSGEEMVQYCCRTAWSELMRHYKLAY